MKKIGKAGWIILHLVCISVLAFCVWKCRELFPETAATAGEYNTQEEEMLHVITPSKKPTPSITPEPTEVPATPEPTGSVENNAPTKIPDSEKNESSENSGTGEGLPDVTPMSDATLMPTELPEKLVEEKNPDEPVGKENPDEIYARLREEVGEKIAQGAYKELDNTRQDWWFVRKKEHVPSGSGESFDISEYDAYYLNKNVEDGDKVIYLTFDCGYENGFTPQILDTLAAHNAKAMFFVTKSFIQSKPDYVIRMKEEGHLVGNHTMSHPAMPKKKVEELVDEILGCAELLYEKTGYQMDFFLRPPEGAYSERTLQLTKDLGFKTIFWSIAYKDYDVKNQPGKDYVTDHFETYYHTGAIPLIHNTSSSNAEALDEVLTMLEEAGYRFGMLTELGEAVTD